jgi:hypothetical protein
MRSQFLKRQLLVLGENRRAEYDRRDRRGGARTKLLD